MMHAWPLFIVLVIGGVATAQPKYESVIRGLVVDDEGQPVSAGITFENSEELRVQKCWARETTVFTAPDGTFRVHEYCGVANRKVLIFIEPASPFKQALSPIYAPY